MSDMMISVTKENRSSRNLGRISMAQHIRLGKRKSCPSGKILKKGKCVIKKSSIPKPKKVGIKITRGAGANPANY